MKNTPVNRILLVSTSPFPLWISNLVLHDFILALQTQQSRMKSIDLQGLRNPICGYTVKAFCSQSKPCLNYVFVFLHLQNYFIQKQDFLPAIRPLRHPFVQLAMVLQWFFSRCLYILSAMAAVISLYITGRHVIGL